MATCPGHLIQWWYTSKNIAVWFAFGALNPHLQKLGWQAIIIGVCKTIYNAVQDTHKSDVVSIRERRSRWTDYLMKTKTTRRQVMRRKKNLMHSPALPDLVWSLTICSFFAGWRLSFKQQSTKKFTSNTLNTISLLAVRNPQIKPIINWSLRRNQSLQGCPQKWGMQVRSSRTWWCLYIFCNALDLAGALYAASGTQKRTERTRLLNICNLVFVQTF